MKLKTTSAKTSLISAIKFLRKTNIIWLSQLYSKRQNIQGRNKMIIKKFIRHIRTWILRWKGLFCCYTSLFRVFPRWGSHFSPDIRNSKQVKKIPGTLFQLNVEEVNFLAKEEHMPRLNPCNKITFHKTSWKDMLGRIQIVLLLLPFKNPENKRC
jgi:hypothetical protein